MYRRLQMFCFDPSLSFDSVSMGLVIAKGLLLGRPNGRHVYLQASSGERTTKGTLGGAGPGQGGAERIRYLVRQGRHDLDKSHIYYRRIGYIDYWE